jgi:succinylglutamate desuccinylase
MKEFTLIKGALPGPTSVIMAGVHGNEYCGIKAIEKVLPILENKIVRGQVIFLLGNPLAVEENKRFIDSNLNRMFKNTRSKYEAHSYEYHRAKFIMSVLDNADALLDLHSTRNPSSPYAFIERINCKATIEWWISGKMIPDDIIHYEKGLEKNITKIDILKATLFDVEYGRFLQEKFNEAAQID